jgi:hypothetical protein
MKDAGTHHHGPLAGLGAGAAAVLFAFGVLALAWHRVAGQVSMAVAFLAYLVMAAVAVVIGAGTWYVVLWVRHRARNPGLLAGRQAARAEVLDEESPQVITARQPAAIEPPRVYLNVTDDQLAALMRQHTEGN